MSRFETPLTSENWSQVKFFSKCFTGGKTRGPAENWRDLFDYFNIDYFKIVLKFQVSQVDSALPTQKSEREAYAFIGNALVKSFHEGTFQVHRCFPRQ